jgi:hypothetical protein
MSYPIDLMLTGKMGELNHEQKQALDTVHSSLQRVSQLVATNRSPQSSSNQP